MPALKAEHHLSDGQLGAIGVLFAVAALTGMQFVGPLTRRIAVRTVLSASLLTMPCCWPWSGSSAIPLRSQPP